MKILKKIVYFFVMFLFLFNIVTSFQSLSQPGMTFIPVFLTILNVVFSLFVFLLLILWGNSKLHDRYLKGVRFLNKITFVILCLILFVMILLIKDYSDTWQAKNLGFTPEENFSDAKNNNIFNQSEYNKFIEKKKLEAEIKGKEERQKEEQEEANCNNDALCYASKHKNSEYECEQSVEKSAQYDFKWTDTIRAQRFGYYRWYDKDKKYVLLAGDKAQAQNGFGAYKNITYQCVFNANTGEVISVSLD